MAGSARRPARRSGVDSRARETRVWFPVPRSAHPSETIWGMTKTVLIVDDHPSFRRSARALLEAEGFKVVGEAGTATDALEEAQRLRPELVLLDVQLPDGSGFDVCATLRSQNGRSPEVVLVSSRDAADFGGLIAACGAAGFVPKAELSGEAVATLLA